MKFWMIAHPFRRKNQEASCSEVLMWAPCDTQGHLIAVAPAASTRASGRPEVWQAEVTPVRQPSPGTRLLLREIPAGSPSRKREHARRIRDDPYGEETGSATGYFTATARG